MNETICLGHVVSESSRDSSGSNWQAREPGQLNLIGHLRTEKVMLNVDEMMLF